VAPFNLQIGYHPEHMGAFYLWYRQLDQSLLRRCIDGPMTPTSTSVRFRGNLPPRLKSKLGFAEIIGKQRASGPLTEGLHRTGGHDAGKGVARLDAHVPPARVQ
jgi:hypothetical protein